MQLRSQYEASSNRKMFCSKLVLIFALQVLCALAVPMHTNQDRLLHYSEQMTKQKWETQKVDALYEIVKKMMYLGNVTIVGWQMIHDDTGVKEIKTMELVLKSSMKTEKAPVPPFKDIDEELKEELPYMLNTMHKIKDTTGTLMMGSTQTWDKYNTLENMIYIDDKDIYMMGEYNEIYRMRNMTMKDMDTVKDMAMKIKTNMPTAILMWNSDGTFDMKESVIVPELISSIRTHTDATPEMMSEALKYLCEGYFMYPDNYLKYLKEKMTKSFPKHNWIAIKGHEGSYTNRDVFMSLEFDMTDIADDALVVDMFGVKKE